MTADPHGAQAAAAHLRRVQQAVRAELQRALAELAQRTAARMRQEAPKALSTLANSVAATPDDPAGLAWLVRPAADYAAWVNRGRQPGRGLPRYFDPAAASAVAWLEARIGDTARALAPRWRPGRIGSATRTQAELALRDRYIAWSRHVRRHGIAPNPYLARTRDAMARPVADGLAAAVRRGLQAAAGPAA